MADIDPINTQPLSDDQELAKVLAGVSQQADDPATTDSDAVSTDTPATPPLPQDDAPTPVTPPVADEPATPVDDTDTSSVSTLPPEAPSMPQSTLPTEEPAPMGMPTSTSGSSELDGIKKEALGELRPLVDKLNVAPEEKFDTYLLLLRSTDDKALIAPAHDAAKNIPDETRRAQALLDIIKEIDFLSQNGQ